MSMGNQSRSETRHSFKERFLAKLRTSRPHRVNRGETIPSKPFIMTIRLDDYPLDRAAVVFMEDYHAG